MKQRRRGSRGRRGQALAELALVLPLLVFIAAGVGDAGRTFFFRTAVINADREALRVAASTGEQATGNAACAAGAPVQTVHLPAQPGDSTLIPDVANAAWLESSTTGAPSNSVLYKTIAPTVLTVKWNCYTAVSPAVAYTRDTPGVSTDPTSPNSATITVTVRYTFSTVTPIISNFFNGLTLTQTGYAQADYTT